MTIRHDVYVWTLLSDFGTILATKMKVFQWFLGPQNDLERTKMNHQSEEVTGSHRNSHLIIGIRRKSQEVTGCHKKLEAARLTPALLDFFLLLRFCIFLPAFCCYFCCFLVFPVHALFVLLDQVSSFTSQRPKAMQSKI